MALYTQRYETFRQNDHHIWEVEYSAYGKEDMGSHTEGEKTFKE